MKNYAKISLLIYSARAFVSRRNPTPITDGLHASLKAFSVVDRFGKRLTQKTRRRREDRGQVVEQFSTTTFLGSYRGAVSGLMSYGGKATIVGKLTENLTVSFSICVFANMGARRPHRDRIRAEYFIFSVAKNDVLYKKSNAGENEEPAAQQPLRRIFFSACDLAAHQLKGAFP
jgi:hypothetical protein